MTNIGTVIDGKYRILDEIGRGGMSVVYLAMDTRLNKQWAVKEIRKRGATQKDEIIINSLQAEANMMKRLDHPALPRIVDIIDNGVTIYVVMDYIEGESLDKVLVAEGAQPEERVVNWGKQLCDVLGYLHNQKKPIIYRDMKPGNVMLKPEGNVKIIDFGIAREYKEGNSKDTTVLGTKGYAPPEQYVGQTDARSDIFALGMTMHHLLTGIEPKAGEPYVPVRQWNPELSEGIEAIINKCCEPSPEKRYQNCAELMYDLEHPDLITKGYKRKQKRRLAAFITAAAMSAVMLIGGFGFNWAATEVKNSNYDAKINGVYTTLEEKLENYEDAIDIYPGNSTAYLRIIDAFLDEEQFGSTESSRLQGLYNTNQNRFDKTSAEYAELNYQMGLLHFNYYEFFPIQDDMDRVNASFSDRMNMAFPYFERNYKNTAAPADYNGKTLNDCYYQICYIYKEYILSHTSVKEVTKENYEEMFDSVRIGLEAVDSADGYDKLVFYNTVFRLIGDQAKQMRTVGVEKETILDKASQVQPMKPRTNALRDEILDHYDARVTAIETTYAAVREGSD